VGQNPGPIFTCSAFWELDIEWERGLLGRLELEPPLVKWHNLVSVYNLIMVALTR